MTVVGDGVQLAQSSRLGMVEQLESEESLPVVKDQMLPLCAAPLGSTASTRQ